MRQGESTKNSPTVRLAESADEKISDPTTCAMNPFAFGAAESAPNVIGNRFNIELDRCRASCQAILL